MNIIQDIFTFYSFSPIVGNLKENTITVTVIERFFFWKTASYDVYMVLDISDPVNLPCWTYSGTNKLVRYANENLFFQLHEWSKKNANNMVIVS